MDAPFYTAGGMAGRVGLGQERKPAPQQHCHQASFLPETLALHITPGGLCGAMRIRKPSETGCCLLAAFLDACPRSRTSTTAGAEPWKEKAA